MQSSTKAPPLFRKIQLFKIFYILSCSLIKLSGYLHSAATRSPICIRMCCQKGLCYYTCWWKNMCEKRSNTNWKYLNLYMDFIKYQVRKPKHTQTWILPFVFHQWDQFYQTFPGISHCFVFSCLICFGVLSNDSHSSSFRFCFAKSKHFPF